MAREKSWKIIYTGKSGNTEESVCSVVTVTVVHNRGDSKNQTKTTNLKCVSSVTTGGSGRPVNAIRFFFCIFVVLAITTFLLLLSIILG